MDDKTNIVARVLHAQIDEDAADILINDYLPFIKSETSKTIQGLSQTVDKRNQQSFFMKAYMIK